MKYRKDLTGVRFGELLVKGYSHNVLNQGAFWYCLCSCGKKKTLPTRLLNYGQKSCGCLSQDKQFKKVHGFSRGTKLQRSFWTRWYNLFARCENLNCKSYKSYGGRGIKIIKRWRDFNEFKKDMHDSFLEHVEEFGLAQTSIDRVNNNKGYSKRNCKWSTRSEQQLNKRNSKIP